MLSVSIPCNVEDRVCTVVNLELVDLWKCFAKDFAVFCTSCTSVQSLMLAILICVDGRKFQQCERFVVVCVHILGSDVEKTSHILLLVEILMSYWTLQPHSP